MPGAGATAWRTAPTGCCNWRSIRRWSATRATWSSRPSPPRPCPGPRTPTCSASRRGSRARSWRWPAAGCTTGATGRRGSPNCRRASAIPGSPTPTRSGWRGATTWWRSCLRSTSGPTGIRYWASSSRCSWRRSGRCHSRLACVESRRHRGHTRPSLPMEDGSMATRRDCLKFTLATAAATALPQARLLAQEAGPLLTRAVPKTGEQLPVVGLGSSATFAQVARSEDVSALREVLQALVEGGGQVFDTAPAYGASEEVAGQIAHELGLGERVFWATKLNAVPRGGGTADPAAAREQLETSFRRLGKDPLDLVQVHNLADIPTQLA